MLGEMFLSKLIIYAYNNSKIKSQPTMHRRLIIEIGIQALLIIITFVALLLTCIHFMAAKTSSTIVFSIFLIIMAILNIIYQMLNTK